MSEVFTSAPLNPSTLLLTNIDVAIVAAVTSGYFQAVDANSGASFWFAEMDSVTNGSYASWRGLKVLQFPVLCKLQNHTTSAAGVVATGWVLRGPQPPYFSASQPPG